MRHEAIASHNTLGILGIFRRRTAKVYILLMLKYFQKEGTTCSIFLAELLRVPEKPNLKFNDFSCHPMRS